MRRILAGRRAKLILCKFAEGSASQGSQERRYEGVRTSVSGHSGIPKSPWMRLRQMSMTSPGCHRHQLEVLPDRVTAGAYRHVSVCQLSLSAAYKSRARKEERGRTSGKARVECAEYGDAVRSQKSTVSGAVASALGRAWPLGGEPGVTTPRHGEFIWMLNAR